MESVKRNSRSSSNHNSVLLQSQLVLHGIQAKQASLESRLNALDAQKIVDLGICDSQNEEEGEIMLLAMILLQLHGVKIPRDQIIDEEDGFNKKKRQRTSPDQLAILEEIFQTDKMPNQQTRVHLADKLGMSSRRVQIWFQNKRAKVKRHGPGKDEYMFSSRRGSLSSDSDDLDSPPMDTEESACSSLNSSSSEIPTTKGSSSFSTPSSTPSSSTPLILSSAIANAIAHTPFDFSPASKQFSLSSFEPKSNLLPDFVSPCLSVAQSI